MYTAWHWFDSGTLGDLGSACICVPSSCLTRALVDRASHRSSLENRTEILACPGKMKRGEKQSALLMDSWHRPDRSADSVLRRVSFFSISTKPCRACPACLPCQCQSQRRDEETLRRAAESAPREMQETGHRAFCALMDTMERRCQSLARLRWELTESLGDMQVRRLSGWPSL